MAYDTKELEEQALEAIKKYRCFFIEDIVAYMSCNRATFYNHGLDKLDTIKDALHKNKVITKSSLRKEWSETGSASERIVLYKLLGTPEEVHRINGSKQEIKHTGKVPDLRISEEAKKKIDEILDEEY